MKYREWNNHSKKFDYGDANLYHLCNKHCLSIGNYNGVELYHDDIIKINNDYFVIWARYSFYTGKLFRCLLPIELKINRITTNASGINIAHIGPEQVIESDCKLKKAQLIGNRYEIDDVKYEI